MEKNPPMWAVGYIDSHGAIHCKTGDAVMHPDILHGRRFRFLVWGQEFHSTLGLRIEQEDVPLVMDYLDRQGLIFHGEDKKEIDYREMI